MEIIINDIIIDDEIDHDYDQLKTFNKKEMINIINSYFNEEEKMKLLRNKEFIKSINSKQLESMLNMMKFNSVFNMLQNEVILNKINYLDVPIEKKDYIVVKSYLDTKKLVFKTSNNMLKNMLLIIEKEKVITYLQKKYITSKLTKNDIIDVSIAKNINLISDFYYIENLNKDELTEYINKKWENKFDYSLIDNSYIKKELFTNENLNYEEILYLYEYINTKSVLSIQKNKHTVESFKAVIILYILLGLDGAKKIIENGNKNLANSSLLSKEVSKEIIDKNFTVKEKTKRIYQNELTKEYLKRCKIKILISILKNNNKELFKDFFKEKKVSEIYDLYLKKFKNISIDKIANNILIPYLEGKKIKNINYKEIIQKTNNFLNYYMDNSYVNSFFLKDLTHYQNNYSYNIDLSMDNYKFNQRIFCLDDITYIFKNTDIYKIQNKKNCQLFLNKYIPLVGSGYYDNIKFGRIISEIDNLDNKTIEECESIISNHKIYKKDI